MNDEGVIKFNCQWTRSAPLEEAWIRDLNVWRDKLYSLGLIGVNGDGIGYGNISIRFRKNEFIISGSGTGKFKKLTGEHYALVTDYNIKKQFRLAGADNVKGITMPNSYGCWNISFVS